jgi:hypothetical protein
MKRIFQYRRPAATGDRFDIEITMEARGNDGFHPRVQVYRETCGIRSLLKRMEGGGGPYRDWEWGYRDTLTRVCHAIEAGQFTPI